MGVVGIGVLRYGMREELFRISRTESCRGILLLRGEPFFGNHLQATIWQNAWDSSTGLGRSSGVEKKFELHVVAFDTCSVDQRPQNSHADSKCTAVHAIATQRGEPTLRRRRAKFTVG